MDSPKLQSPQDPADLMNRKHSKAEASGNLTSNDVQNIVQVSASDLPSQAE